jgi:hypothetical protein
MSRNFMSGKATSFYWAVCAAGLAALALGAWYFAISDLTKFLVYLFVSVFASRLKINIP